MERSQDNSKLLQASRYLALGSAFLLVWSLLSLWIDEFGWIVAFTLPLFAGAALSIHFLGWIGLKQEFRRTRGMTWTFRMSLLGFGIGLATLPFAPLPPLPGGWVFVPSVFLIAGGFAFVPTVYGPIVIAHSVFFMMNSRVVGNRRSSWTVISGSVFLIAIVTIGIALQVHLVSNPLVPIITLAGITGFGYFLVSTGLRRKSNTPRFTLLLLT